MREILSGIILSVPSTPFTLKQVSFLHKIDHFKTIQLETIRDIFIGPILPCIPRLNMTADKDSRPVTG